MGVKKILVTGADGFIGSHLTEALVSEGFPVKALTWYNSFAHRGWLEKVSSDIEKKIEFIAGDIRDPHFMKQAVQGVDCIFHLASLIAIPYSYHAPTSYVQTNISGTLNVLQAAREVSVKKIFHVSTSEIYGTAQKIPIDEHHPAVAQSPYAASKIAADALAESFYRAYDLPITILRPFNTFGPRQSARAVIPTILTQIMSGSTNIKLGSLSPIRDFTFISDTVNAFIKALNTENTTGQTINIGSGQGVSIAELVQIIAKIIQVNINVIEDKERVRPEKSEVVKLICDNSKAKELICWEPEVSLEEGLKKTSKWFRDPKNLAGYKAELYNI